MAKEQITGVVYTGEMAEWATVRRGKGGVEVLTSGSVRLRPERGEGADGDSEQTPSDTMRIALHGAGRSLVVGLPLSQLLLRVIELPAVEDDELPEMVELQVDKFSPFPVDQMVVSHEVIRRSEDDCSVLVAAVKRSVVDDMGQLLAGAGLVSSRVDASVMGWWHALTRGDYLEKEGRETLIRVDRLSVEMIVQYDGIPRSFSFIGEGVDFSSEEEATEVADEIAHALMTLEMEHGKSSRNVITVWCDGDEPQAFVSALEQASGCDVRVRSLSLLPGLAGSLATREESGCASLNLTPAAWLDAVRSKGFRKRTWLSAAAVLALWVLLVGGGLGSLVYQRIRLDGLQQKDEQLLPAANEVRTMRRKAEMVSSYMNHTNSALECLREVSRLLPQGIDLTEFTYRKEDSVAIVGEAKSGQLVLKFNEKLNKSIVFAEVIPGSRNITKKRRHRFRFDLRLPEELE